ncbi:HNH endonuclease signature motif containing protein [Pedococcus soli]
MSVSPLTAVPDTVPDGGWGARNQALWERTAAVAGRLNRAQAELVDIIDEVMRDRHWGEGGFKSPEHYLVVRAGLSHAHAADIVAVARRRTELTDAAVALEAGELSLDQVAVLARHVPVTHQASVTQFARNATVTQLRRAVARHAFAAPAPAAHAAQGTDAAGSDLPVEPHTLRFGDLDTAALPSTAFESAAEQRACAKPDLAMSYDADGRFQLRYSAPATIGALVEQAVKEAKDALFLRRKTDASATDLTGADVDDRYAGLPTYADALEEMATRSLAAVTSTSRSAHYRIYLHLDTTGAWVNGGHAIPLRLLGRFISDGQVQPVWETEGRPVSVGRAMRILPHRTRRLITDRDRGCRFPGCPTTGFVEVHHLQAWADGGATDTDNQISLCTTHHDGIDRGDYTITGDPTHPDGLTVTNRYGLPIRPPRPHETAPPPDGDPPVPAGTYQPPSGGPISWNDLALTSDHELTHGTPPPPGLSLAPPPAAQTISWLNDPDNPDRGLIRTNWGHH